ncbi:MAG: hypothetical protein ACXQS5_05250 [Candidatus Methanospirareceae archaeon]
MTTPYRVYFVLLEDERLADSIRAYFQWMRNRKAYMYPTHIFHRWGGITEDGKSDEGLRFDCGFDAVLASFKQKGGNA